MTTWQTVEQTVTWTSTAGTTWQVVRGSTGGGGGGGASAINDLTDVDTATDPPATDDVLAWDGSLWTPAALTAADTGAIPESLIDAKGDLIVGTANDTAARLAVGANGQVLTADSGEAGGVKWAAPSGIADPGGSNDDFLQRKAGAWTNRTVAQIKADLNLPVVTTAVAGQTYGMGGVVGSDSTYLNALNRWWGCICYLPAGSYDLVVFNVLTTGTSTWSMGIYPLNPATGLVDSGTAPLHNIGDVNLSLATGAISVTTSFSLSTPRLVWIGGSVSAYTSTATVRSVGSSDAAATRLLGAPLGGTLAGGVANGGLATGIRVAAGTGTAGVDNFPSGSQFAGVGPKIQVRAA